MTAKKVEIKFDEIGRRCELLFDGVAQTNVGAFVLRARVGEFTTIEVETGLIETFAEGMAEVKFKRVGEEELRLRLKALVDARFLPHEHMRNRAHALAKEAFDMGLVAGRKQMHEEAQASAGSTKGEKS